MFEEQQLTELVVGESLSSRKLEFEDVTLEDSSEAKSQNENSALRRTAKEQLT